MTIFAINGIEFGSYIAEGSLSFINREIGGGASRAFDGTTRKSRIIVKRDIAFETVPMTLSDADAWERLILGLGHCWKFTYATYGFYSSKGLGPDAGYSASIVNAAGATGANGLLRLPAAGTITYSLYPSGATAWTIIFWRYESGAWHNYIVNSSSQKWYDGVRNDALSTTFLTASATAFTLANASGSAVDYDEINFLPFAIPTSWGAEIGSPIGVFGLSPELYLLGSLITNPSVRSVIGSVTAKETKCVLSGTLQAAKILSVTLEET